MRISGQQCIRVAFTLAFLAGNLAAQYVTAQVCGSCHADRWTRQSGSEHALALRRVADHALVRLFVSGRPIATGANSPYLFARTATGFVVRIGTGANDKTIPVEWAFGAGEQAVTFVSQLDEDSYLEH